MSSIYVPVEKYELHSLSQPLTGASESKIPLSLDQSNPKHFNTGYPWRGMPVSKPKRPSRLSSILGLLKALLLPLIAIAYLTFCYVVHYRVVPVSAHGILNVSPQNIASIKAGVTSISILVVTIGLFPLRDLIQALKSEEFFRVVSTSPSGVPISVANSVSNPSFSNMSGLKAVLQHRVTSYFAAAVVAGFAAMATSTLAPAALTVQSVLIDGGLQAFAVGAVPPQAVFNASDAILWPGTTADFTANSDKAASIAYVESSIGVTYNFDTQSDSNTTSYIIPTPSALSTTTSARWLSDVITINPTCAFVKSNITQPISFNTSSVNESAIAFNLPDAGIDLIVGNNDINQYSSINYVQPVANSLSTADGLTQLVNHTTNMIPSDGSSVWVLAQCVGNGCVLPMYPAIYIDFTGLPITQANTPNGTLQLVFLHCLPHPIVATHEIRSDGQGHLAVEPDGNRTFQKQGNLNPPQAGMLLSAAFQYFTDSAGPNYGISGFGPQVQVEFIFGKQTVASINTTSSTIPPPITTLVPQPMVNITATYTTMAQAAAKVFMTGTLGTAHVPGRITTSDIIFDSSLPHVIASTILFGALSVLVIVAHFRSGKEEPFTLYGIAAALHGSEMPARFSQTKTEEGLTDDLLVKSLGNRLVSMTRNGDGSVSLRLN